MSRYYITRRDGTIISLDATTELTERFKARTTSHPVASGASITDTVIQDQPQFKLSGIISDVLQPDLSKSNVAEATGRMIRTIINGEVVVLQGADRAYNVCVLTDVAFSKTSKEGVDGWKANLTLSQITVINSLDFFVTPVGGLTSEQQAIKDEVEAKRRASATAARQKELNDRLEKQRQEKIRQDRLRFEYERTLTFNRTMGGNV